LTRADSATEASGARQIATALTLGTAALGLVALFFHAKRYYPFYSDDALISLRYSERLMAGQGLTWNDGEWVEGYSNLSWVLACALLGWLGLDLVFALRVLGFIGMGGAIAAVVHCYAPRDARSVLPALVGSLGMALTGSFAIWSIGGLEQAFVAGLLAWALVATLPLIEAKAAAKPAEEEAPIGRALAAGGLYGALCLTRPDAPIFVACSLFVVLRMGAFGARARRTAFWLVLPSLLALGGQLAFRIAYYDAWLPNTAHAKVAFSGPRLWGGLAYWWGGVLPLMGLVFPAIAQLGFAAFNRRVRGRSLLFALPLFVWSLWVMAIGGDIFPGRRHLVVVVVLLAFLAAEFWRGLEHFFLGREFDREFGIDPGREGDPRPGEGKDDGRGRAANLGIALPAVLAGVALMLLTVMQWSHDRHHGRALREILWAQQGEALGRVLGEAFDEEQPLLAATAAGALPYYSKLPALDMLGLNDRYLALHPPEDLGHGRVGHELGDGQYFLTRQPDLVVFCGTSGRAEACSRGGKEMQRDPRFERDYRLVYFKGTEPVRMKGAVWVLAQSPKVGVAIRDDGREIFVPAHLFSDGEGAIAGLDEEGRIGITIAPDRGARLAAFDLEGGRWRVTSSASAPVEITIRAGDRTIASGAGSVALGLPAGDVTRLDIRLSVAMEGARGGTNAHVRGLEFVREAAAKRH